MTQHTEHGRMDNGWDDERTTLTTYTSDYSDGQRTWILWSIVDQKITDENAVVATHLCNYYDGNTTLGTVSKGNLTMTENWLENKKYIITERNDYDAYGNIIAIYDPLYGIQPGHFRSLIYDSLFHMCPEQEIIYTGNDNAATLNFRASYDIGFGVVISSTEFNGHMTTYEYDTFARLTAITNPPDNIHTVQYQYALAHALTDGRTINWIETR